jgi:hypothetical protein
MNLITPTNIIFKKGLSRCSREKTGNNPMVPAHKKNQVSAACSVIQLIVQEVRYETVPYPYLSGRPAPLGPGWYYIR